MRNGGFQKRLLLLPPLRGGKVERGGREKDKAEWRLGANLVPGPGDAGAKQVRTGGQNRAPRFVRGRIGSPPGHENGRFPPFPAAAGPDPPPGGVTPWPAGAGPASPPGSRAGR